jgi:hypothetical protein
MKVKKMMHRNVEWASPKGVITPLGHLRRGGGEVIIPWVNLTVTGNGGRSQRAAGRKTASPPLPPTRKFCRSSSCWATTRFMDR